MPLIDHFGWIAPYYDRLASPPDVDGWLDRLRLPVDGYLLDAGGGTGRLSAPLLPYTRGVLVADSSMEMVRMCAAKPGLAAVRGETECLPFPCDFFDRIMMVDALHHVYSQKQTVAELLRVLKPGGFLVIEEPDLRYGRVKLVALFEKLLLMRSHIYTSDQALALFAGLPVRTELQDGASCYCLTVEKLPA